MADGAEDGVGGIALATFEIAAAEVAVGFHVSDDGFDSRATAQLALDRTEDAAPLAGDEDAERVCDFVASVTLVDIGALDGATGQFLGGFDDGGQRVAIVGIAGSALACSTNWPPGARALVMTIEALTPNS